MFIGKVSQGQSKMDMGKGLHCGIWEPELTIGHTRGEVLSLILPASAEVTGALSRWLRRLALQHADYVHTVNALQSYIQALHCRHDVWKRDTKRGDTQHNHYNPDVTLTRLKTESST